MQRVPETDNRAIIDTLIHDLLNHSDADREGFITYSPEVEHALVTLRAFSRERIYNNPKADGRKGEDQNHVPASCF